MTREEILKAYSEGRRDFSRVKIPGVDLHGADLSNSTFVVADLTGANLSHANFTGADLGAANLSGATIKGAKFTKAKLRGSVLRGVLAARELPPIFHTQPRSASFDQCDLWEADLSEAALAWASFAGADLERANASGAILTLCNFERTRLISCRLDRARLWNADLTKAILTDTGNIGARRAPASLVGADLSFTSFPAELTAMNLSGANISGWKLVDAQLESCDLSDAQLQNCSFVNGTIRNCNLRGCHFSSCDLHFTDLVGSRGGVLDYTRTAGARFSPGQFKAPSWVTLSNSYTGVKTLFHLLLLLAFLLPLVARVAFWVGVNKVQVVQGGVASSVKAAEARLDSTARTLGVSAPTAIQFSPCLAQKCDSLRVWEVVLGLNRGWETWLPAILLLIYNAIRVYLTWKVGPLRDRETTTEFSPRLGDYRHLWWLHVAFSVLLLVALSSAAISAFDYLSLPVWIPTD